jgi:hypothetical protein
VACEFDALTGKISTKRAKLSLLSFPIPVTQVLSKEP